MLNVDFILEYPIFRDFDEEDLKVLGGLCEPVRLEAGQTVAHEGEPGDALYIIREGVLEVLKASGAKKAHVNLLSAGEFFGEMALIDGSPRSATIVAQEPGELVRLSREAFLRLKKEHPATGFKVVDVLLKTLSFRLRRSNKKAFEA